MTGPIKMGYLMCAVLITSQPYVKAAPIPNRIVSINLCTDELLLRLADRKKIVAITQYSSKPNSSVVYDEVKDIPKIQGEIEEIMSYAPDLVVATVFTNRETIEMLDRLKIPTVILNIPSNFEEIYENIEILGRELGESEKARQLIQSMKRRLAELKLENPREPLRAVFYQSSGNMPGLKSLTASTDEGAPQCIYFDGSDTN